MATQQDRDNVNQGARVILKAAAALHLIEGRWPTIEAMALAMLIDQGVPPSVTVGLAVLMADKGLIQKGDLIEVLVPGFDVIEGRSEFWPADQKCACGKPHVGEHQPNNRVASYLND
jgi:hypothetical protein